MPARVIVEGDDPGFRSRAGQLLTDRGFSVVRVAGIGNQAIAVAWFLPEARPCRCPVACRRGAMTLFRRWAVAAVIVVAGLAAVGALLWGGYQTPTRTLVVILIVTLGVGWSFAGFGLLAWVLWPTSLAGPLMVAVGLAWFARTLGAVDHPWVFERRPPGRLAVLGRPGASDRDLPQRPPRDPEPNARGGGRLPVHGPADTSSASGSTARRRPAATARTTTCSSRTARPRRPPVGIKSSMRSSSW